MKAFLWASGVAFVVIGAWILYAPYYGRSTGEEMFGKGPPSVPAEPPQPVAVAPVAAATPPKPAATPQAGLIRAADLGDAWPFEVPEGVVSCIGRDGIGIAIFTVGSTRYALNGMAKEANTMRRYNLRDIKEIWRRNPEMPELRINIGPAIDAALKLCTM